MQSACESAHGIRAAEDRWISGDYKSTAGHKLAKIGLSVNRRYRLLSVKRRPITLVAWTSLFKWHYEDHFASRTIYIIFSVILCAFYEVNLGKLTFSFNSFVKRIQNDVQGDIMLDAKWSRVSLKFRPKWHSRNRPLDVLSYMSMLLISDSCDSKSVSRVFTGTFALFKYLHLVFFLLLLYTVSLCALCVFLGSCKIFYSNCVPCALHVFSWNAVEVFIAKIILRSHINSLNYWLAWLKSGTENISLYFYPHFYSC